MPRQRRLRKVVAPPKFKGYKPHGNLKTANGYIELLYEEFEAINLADYKLLKHDEAAELMGVSRPTFARIYESARRKIAKALVEVKEIRAVYGNAWMDGDWYICESCHARFNIPNTNAHNSCPICKSKNIEPINKKL